MSRRRLSDVCPIDGAPMTEGHPNVYVPPNGPRRCRTCLLRNKRAYERRQRLLKLAQAAASGTETDRFTYLTEAAREELRGLPAAERDRYYLPPGTPGRRVTKAEKTAGRWAQHHVGMRKAGELTGLSGDGPEPTLAQLGRRAAKARAHGTTGPWLIPEPAPGGTWRIAALALWRAASYQHYSAGNPGRWDREWVPDDQIVPIIEAAIADYGRTVEVAQIREELLGAGLDVYPPRIGWLIRSRGLHTVAPGIPEGPEPAPGESLRWDGLLTTGQLAAWFEVTPSAVTGAVKRGELTPAAWERSRRLFNPDKVAARADQWPGPVDADSPLAYRALRPAWVIMLVTVLGGRTPGTLGHDTSPRVRSDKPGR